MREYFETQAVSNPAFRKVWEWLKGRKRTYVQAFRTPAGEAVLADLASFCRACEAPAVLTKDGTLDVHRTMIGIGRQEVWLRIQQHLQLTPEQLMLLFQGKPIRGQDD